MLAQSVAQICSVFFCRLPFVVEPHEVQVSSDTGILPIRQFDDQIRLHGSVHRLSQRPGRPEPDRPRPGRNGPPKDLRHPGRLRELQRPLHAPR